MPPPLLFDLQGHRGARGLQPENTLPSFEAALDAGASSVETDLRRTCDGVVVLCHDPTTPAGAAVAALRLDELRQGRGHGDAGVPPLAVWYAQKYGFDPFAVATLADLFAFVAAYAGEPGAAAGKTVPQRERAARLRFDLELKTTPFRPDHAPGVLEAATVEAVRAASVADRTTVRSFDHRCVRRLRRLEPRLTGAVLVAHTAPAAPAELARQADAAIYCPSYDFVDEELVRQAHAADVRVLPWTVNDADDWRRLLAWGVDGITTDYPDRLAERLHAWGVPF